jgi:hypothetical protein
MHLKVDIGGKIKFNKKVCALAVFTKGMWQVNLVNWLSSQNKFFMFWINTVWYDYGTCLKSHDEINIEGRTWVANLKIHMFFMTMNST